MFPGDGTGQQTDAPVASQSPEKTGDGAEWTDWVPATNVTRLCRVVAYADTVNGKEIDQITFYQVRALHVPRLWELKLVL
jgi:hypothetical protein